MTGPAVTAWQRMLVIATAIAAALVVSVGSPATAQPEPAPTTQSDAAGGDLPDCADVATGPCRIVATELPAPVDGGPVGGWTARAAGGVFSLLVGWVVAGARWVITEVVGAMNTLTRPDLTAGWFTGYLARMGQVAGGWLALLFLAAVIDGAVRGRGDVLGRALLLLPAAAAGTTVAVFVLDLLVAATDHAAGWLLAGADADLTGFATTVGTSLAEYDAEVAAAAALLVAFAVIVAGLLVWVELLVRDAAVYIAVLFLPLAFAGMVWPATGHWLGRLLRLLVAVILSKLVIVAVVGLGATMLADGMAADGMAPVIVGAGTLLLAGCTPFVLYRIVQVWDIDQASGLHGALGGAVGRVAAPAVGGAVVASKFLTSTPTPPATNGTGTSGDASDGGSGGQ